MEKKVFEPIIVDTREVVKELKSVSATYKLPLQDIDFRILEVTTFFKTNKDEEWEEVNENNQESFESDEFFGHENLEVFQQYKIEIFQGTQKDDDLPKISLGSNKTLTSVIATIHKTNDVDTSKFLEDKLIEFINKKKVKAGILVSVREKNMKKEISSVASKMMVNGFLDADVSFEVMAGIRPVACIDDEFILHYQKKINKEDESGRINYAKRGYVLPVEEGEVIFEYIKAKEGKNGRNCRGKYLRVRPPVEKNKQEVKISEAIKVSENDDSIKYIAVKQGYVKEDKGVYDIQDEMDIEGVSFKSTGSIEAGVDSNVTINIKESNDHKDAIGEGMKVETTVLNVEGSVAKNAHIKAIEVNIGGQTHKTSIIECKKATVSVHRGTIEAKEVNIDRLEGGRVVADIARIKNVIGGEIVAREIHIDLLKSNSSLVTSELIELKNIRGTNNKILVDPSQIKELREKIQNISEEIEGIKKACTALPKQLDVKKDVIENSKGAINNIKQKVVELKSQGITPPKNLLHKLKEYQKLVNEYNELLAQLQDKKDEVKILEEELSEYQSKVFSAKVINRGSWTELNEIKFKLIYPPIEIVHNTRQNEMSREITLRKTTEDEYIIKRSTEYDS